MYQPKVTQAFGSYGEFGNAVDHENLIQTDVGLADKKFDKPMFFIFGFKNYKTIVFLVNFI